MVLMALGGLCVPFGTAAVTRQHRAAQGPGVVVPCVGILAGLVHGCSELSFLWQGKSCPLSLWTVTC